MGTHHRGTPKERKVLDAWIKLARASAAVSRRTSEHLAGHGLTETQFGALEALLHLGPLSQKSLAEKLLTCTGNITAIVDQLAERGLVHRQRGEEDRRISYVHLTDAGRAEIEKIFATHLGHLMTNFNVLSEDELEQMAALCRKVGLGEHGLAARNGSNGHVGKAAATSTQTRPASAAIQ